MTDALLPLSAYPTYICSDVGLRSKHPKRRPTHPSFLGLIADYG